MECKRVERLCANSGCEKVGIHLCSGCGEEIYCSKECQKNHWIDHKTSCKKAVKPEAAVFMQSFDALSTKQLINLLKAKAASFEPKKKALVLNQLENTVEKAPLLFLVKQHVQPSEIEVLLSASNVVPTATPSMPDGSQTKSKKRSSNMQNASNPNTPSPDQLRQQATMMRRNPEQVRKSNPMFAKMTNQQICQYADQLEKAASDPAMLEEIEKMSKFSNKEREQLQVIQEGLTGAREMDDKWLKHAIAALKSNPGLFKTMLSGKGAMLGGVTDEQVAYFIDTVSGLDARLLSGMFYAIRFLSRIAKPAMEYYTIADTYSLGLVKYVLLFAAAAVVYYVSAFWWRVTVWLVTAGYRVVNQWRGVPVPVPVSSSAGVAGAAAVGAGGVTSALESFKASVQAVFGMSAAPGQGQAASAALAAAGASAVLGGAGTGAVLQEGVQAAAQSNDQADAEFQDL